MAKAKKPEATEAQPAKAPAKAKSEPARPAAAKALAQPKAPATKASARKPAAKKPKKEDKPARPAGTPLVDTSLAAESAARMLMGKARLGPVGTPPTAVEPDKESASFKQFKESVNKPATHTPGKAAANPFAPKNPLPIPGSNQVFHNQTQGGVSRINVPRRTGG